MTARWIALEGGEGSGKSTQAALLASALDAVLTREPGGTPVGAALRSLVLDPSLGDVDPRAEALVMAADRAQHLASIVVPALATGRHVVSDRSVWSSLAYQGYGRGLELATLRSISDWAMDGRWPDLAVLIDVPPLVAAGRMAGRAADRMEAAGSSFHDRVREGFASLTASEPGAWAVVDGSGSVEEVAAAVLGTVRERLRLPG